MSEKNSAGGRTQHYHRAFYGVTNLTNSEGLHTNAIFGFLNTLFKVLDEEKPDYLTVAFDVRRRPSGIKCMMLIRAPESPCPRSCTSRCRSSREVLHAMGILTMEKAGLEAGRPFGNRGEAKREEGHGGHGAFRGPGIFCSWPRSISGSACPRPRAGHGDGKLQYPGRDRPLSGDASADHRAESPDGRLGGPIFPACPASGKRRPRT